MSSKSSSKTTQTTEQYDQRILAEEGSFVIGSEASYDNQFGEEVANAFDRLIDFASGAGEAALKSTETTQTVLAEQLAAAKAPSTAFIIKALPYLVVIAVAAFGIKIMMVKK